MHYWDYGFGGWAGGALALISMLLLWGGLITVVVVLLRRFAHPYRGGHDEAMRILDERFARGEIDKDEYELRRSALRR
ncbi:MAG TPA: SHOCT domain-containing protein [Amycolatopsis sp.]|uniref:SHOCT domain-containing protein n=1 Tax=Amycolatopsis sp. TaxID=37632 RepID=UPI002B4AA49E|nr:SHOCT domain-containing protein [Amycolatopsis sp.]HKS46918.1 SHOCT domain-containing protein [Amycolatopsis sp.]